MNIKHSNLIVQSLIYQARQASSRESLRALLSEAMLTYEIHCHREISYLLQQGQ